MIFMCIYTLAHQLGIYKENNYEDRSVGLKTYWGSGVGCGVVHRLLHFHEANLVFEPSAPVGQL
jgi:hypothetical protein